MKHLDLVGDVNFKTKMNIRLAGREKVVDKNIGVCCAEPVESPCPLKHSGGVPGQIVIDKNICPMEVHPFSKHVGGYENTQIVRRRFIVRVERSLNQLTTI